MKEIIDLVSNKVNSEFLLLTAGITLFFIYITKEAWVKLISGLKLKDFGPLFRKKPQFQYTINDLEKHDLFTDIISYKDTRYEFYTHGEIDIIKSRIFSDFLNTKLDSTYKNMLKISKEATIEMSRVDLKAHVNGCFSTCNINLEKNLEKLFIANGLNKEMSQQVMDKFYTVRKTNMIRYNRRIDSIFACSFYENNFQLILALYEVIAYELHDIIQDSIKAFNDINGLFLNLEYGG
jgi:hypothetical protein